MTELKAVAVPVVKVTAHMALERPCFVRRRLYGRHNIVDMAVPHIGT